MQKYILNQYTFFFAHKKQTAESYVIKKALLCSKLCKMLDEMLEKNEFR